MKKLITTVALITALASPSAFAKTKGHYVGLSLIDSRVKGKFSDSVDSTSYSGKERARTGVGVDYKYAFNLGNGFFVAPGLFYDKLGTKADFNSANYRYGAKLDLGYDIADKVAVYFTNGLARTNSNYINDADLRKTTTDLDYFYGVGVAYSPIKNWSVKFEYTTQNSETHADSGFSRVKSNLDLYKVGLAYNF